MNVIIKLHSITLSAKHTAYRLKEDNYGHVMQTLCKEFIKYIQR